MVSNAQPYLPPAPLRRGAEAIAVYLVSLWRSRRTSQFRMSKFVFRMYTNANPFLFLMWQQLLLPLWRPLQVLLFYCE